MEASNPKPERHFLRWTPVQRTQHIILMISFFGLVITGLPVLFPDAPASSHVIGLLGGFTMRAILHRAAAIILIALSGFHVLFVMFSQLGHSEFMAMMPNKKDITDAIHMLKFYLGLAPDKPKFDRYNYIEKFEYLALAWGTVAMAGTGLVLWFEEQAMLVLPKWTLDVATVIHSYEALLAFLAIIIWHFYHVHLNPEVFPMSRTWLTGTISEHEMKEHHPLEYERICRNLRRAEETAETIEAGVKR